MYISPIRRIDTTPPADRRKLARRLQAANAHLASLPPEQRMAALKAMCGLPAATIEALLALPTNE